MVDSSWSWMVHFQQNTPANILFKKQDDNRVSTKIVVVESAWLILEFKIWGALCKMNSMEINAPQQLCEKHCYHTKHKQILLIMHSSLNFFSQRQALEALEALSHHSKMSILLADICTWHCSIMLTFILNIGTKPSPASVQQFFHWRS